MPARPRRVALPGCATLATTALLASCAGESSVPLPHDDRAALAATSSVTLITGDRVWLDRRPDGRTAVSIDPGAGRDHVAFVQQRVMRNGVEDVTVMPRDAAPLVASGQLDRRLFEVTALARRGLDDQQGRGLPLIIRFDRSKAAAAPRTLVVGKALPSIDATAVVEATEDAGTLWSALTESRGGAKALGTGLASISLDGLLHTVLDESVPQVGAPEAWAAGFTGDGAAVAVLDTGIDATHPDLQGQIRDIRDFTGAAPDGADDNGHGTHVAGTIAGTGAASDGAYRGVAPGADLLIGKVCNAAGGCLESDIIAGMEWAAVHAPVVNVSLGGWPSAGQDSVSMAVNALSAEHGTLFVIAAGNWGGEGWISTPGAADAALTVGSVTKDDVLSEFSSRGPRLLDAAIKPDIVAPGSDIVAARVPGTELGDHDPVGEHYARASGTSMATPHVAGAAALLAAAHPDWDGVRLKATLMSAALPLDGIAMFAQGAGRLDVARGVSQRAHASPASLSFGALGWPHDQAPVTMTVTLHNEGDDPLTFDCVLDVRGPDGQAAPDGMFTVDSSQVTIPGGGSHDVAVTLRPQPRTAAIYGGWLRATSGATRVVVAVGVLQEPEQYWLTVQQIGRDGEPGQAMVTLRDRDTGDDLVIDADWFSPDGFVGIRMLRDSYAMTALVETADGENPAARSMAMFANGDITLDRDMTIVLDARTAQPVAATVDRAGAVIDGASMTIALIEVGAGYAWSTGYSASDGTLLLAAPARPAPDQRLEFASHFALAADDPDGTPVRYELGFASEDGIPEILSHAVRDRDLARVDTTYRAQGAPTEIERIDSPEVSDMYVSPPSRYHVIPQPSKETLFLSADDRFTWHTTLVTQAADGAAFDLTQAVRRYPRGRHREEWNRAPVGPGFLTDAPDNAAVHHGDGIYLHLPLFSPSEPGHVTRDWVVEQTATLWRNGELVAAISSPVPIFPATPEAADYRLEVDARRAVPWSVLATQVKATWTFAAGLAADQSQAPLPLLAVRAAGHVDDGNAAPAGAPHLLALRVERQANVTMSPVTALTLEVSYDDGATWQSTPVVRIGNQGFALLFHPAAPGFVSLRTRAADRAGSTVDQTVIRAYRIE